MEKRKFIDVGVMSIFTLVLILVGALLQASVSAEENWYDRKLREDKHYVTDFLLEAGKSKLVSIDADVDITAGCYVDVTNEQHEKYMAKDFFNAFDAECTIKKSDGDIEKAEVGFTGAGMSWKLERGEKITEMKIINNMEEDCNIVIYTMPEPH